jgi:hypothetical protein
VLRKEIAAEHDYKYVGVFHEDIAVAGDEYGNFFYINRNGRPLSVLQIQTGIGDRSQKFKDGIGVAYDVHTESACFIDKNGDVVYGIEPLLNSVRPFSEGFAAVRDDKGWYYIGRDFKTIITLEDLPPNASIIEIGDFKNGRAIIRIKEAWRNFAFFIDKSGKKIKLPGLGETMFDYIGEFHEDLSVMISLMKLFIYNQKTKQVTSLEAVERYFGDSLCGIGDFHDSIAVFEGSQDNYEDAPGESPLCIFIKSDGKLLHPEGDSFFAATQYCNGLAAVKKDRIDNHFYYIDKSGKKAFDREFIKANAFEDGLAWVSDAPNQFYCIDTSGNSAFDDKNFRIDRLISGFIDGVAEVYVGKERIFIDRRGRKIF